VSYAANDPGAAYQTLLLLEKSYTREYHTLQFGSTSTAIQYFEEELARVGKELRENEDSLTNYNVRNRIINYDEQTKQVAALDMEFELRYQDILLNYNSANASIRYLETQMEENVQYLKGNAEFLSKLNRVSDLNTKVAEMEAFYTDSISSTYRQQQLNNYKQQLEQAEKELMDFSKSFSNRKYTREGYPTSNFVTQWLEELLKLEKAKAEIQVMEAQKQELDKQYSHFSPIGSTIKRQERSIDFVERNYLAILTSLNAARLRLKSLEMSSASLKLINPPVFPLNAEPSKRKTLVMGAYGGSLIFLLGFFLLLDLLDRTLRDRIHTEYLTGAKVLGALPGKGKLRQRRYTKTYRQKAVQYMANALQDYFKPGDPGPIVNIISTEPGTGKSFLIDLLIDYWGSQGIRVQSFCYGKDFDPASSEFLFAGSIRELTGQESESGRTIFLIEHAPISIYSIPKALLQEASVNLTVVRADRSWKDNDKLLFTRLQEQSGTTPVLICLNRAEKEVVESFTGMLPPYTHWHRLFYRYTQFGFTASGKS
ncbi:MAG: exopolysaccharide biosynthesis protein, partial [Porphyromonadaceae bacterium]|nr:exopolysaccharide biosynthesis protein [Porphyromonadaceae bacterium]